MEFAYSCADKMVYIRKFSTNGSKMTLSNTLQGHEAEVTCVKWNNISHKWVTGAEDGTIRIWVKHFHHKIHLYEIVAFINIKIYKRISFIVNFKSCDCYNYCK